MSLEILTADLTALVAACPEALSAGESNNLANRMWKLARPIAREEQSVPGNVLESYLKILVPATKLPSFSIRKRASEQLCEYWNRGMQILDLVERWSFAASTDLSEDIHLYQVDIEFERGPWPEGVSPDRTCAESELRVLGLDRALSCCKWGGGVPRLTKLLCENIQLQPYVAHRVQLFVEIQRKFQSVHGESVPSTVPTLEAALKLC